MINKKNKGQGALEYLLIIGGALLVAVVVIVIITSTGRTSEEVVRGSTDSYSSVIDSTIIPPIITSFVCSEDLSEVTFYITPSPTAGVGGYKLIYNNNPIGDSKQITDNQLDFNHSDYSGVTFDSGDTFALVAVRNDMYSQPTYNYKCN